MAEIAHRSPSVELDSRPRLAEVERQPDTLYSWSGRPLARHGQDLHLPDGRWWGRILPRASSIFDERGTYLADLLEPDRIATDPWKQGIPAGMFLGGWDEIERPADREPYHPPLRERGDGAPPAPECFREPDFPSP
jgi:hypothetical protein